MQDTRPDRPQAPTHSSTPAVAAALAAAGLAQLSLRLIARRLFTPIQFRFQFLGLCLLRLAPPEESGFPAQIGCDCTVKGTFTEHPEPLARLAL